jgi:hypothetical protein
MNDRMGRFFYDVGGTGTGPTGGGSDGVDVTGPSSLCDSVMTQTYICRARMRGSPNLPCSAVRFMVRLRTGTSSTHTLYTGVLLYTRTRASHRRSSRQRDRTSQTLTQRQDDVRIDRGSSPCTGGGRRRRRRRSPVGRRAVHPPRGTVLEVPSARRTGAEAPSRAPRSGAP